MKITTRDIRLMFYLAKDKIPGVRMEDAALAWQIMSRRRKGMDAGLMTIAEASRIFCLSKYEVKKAVDAAGIAPVDSFRGIGGRTQQVFRSADMLASLGFEPPEEVMDDQA